MPQVIDWRSAAEPREVIELARKLLQEGKIVAFPTETVYGLAASAQIPEAVERLCLTKGRTEEKPLTIAIADARLALEWVPELSAIGQRLARRCWPGPLTIVSSAGAERGRLTQLPEAVRRRVAPRSAIGLRVPAHLAVLGAAAECPLVLTSANVSGRPAAVTGAEVLEALADSDQEIALLIDDDRTLFGQGSTVIEVAGESWRVLRHGVLTEDMLRRQSACFIVFVCTGNTCRSPMAEALAKKILAKRLGCSIEELPERGYVVMSAGIAAAPDNPASPESQTLIQERGGDLQGHRSRPITLDTLHQADHVLAMTRGHLFAMMHLVGSTENLAEAGRSQSYNEITEVTSKIRLIDPSGCDIPDPLGGEMHHYVQCADAIEKALEHWLTELPQ